MWWTDMDKDFDSMLLLVEALNIIVGMVESSLQWQNFGTRKVLQKKTMSIQQGQHRWFETKYHFYTSVHSKPFGSVYCSLCWCEISVCSNHLKETQATEGRGRWGSHTHGGKTKGYWHQQKNYIWCYCHNRVFSSAQVSSVLDESVSVSVCVCVCERVCIHVLCVCLCVFKSTSSVDQTYVLFQTYIIISIVSIYILYQHKPKSPSSPAPFKKWTSQWGDTAQVSIFPQETSVYISKWVQKESCFDC